MQVPASKTKNRLSVFLFLLLMAFALNLVYRMFLQEANEYMGYRPIDAGFEYWSRVLLCVFIAALMMPVQIARPSDFFFLFYGALVVLPYVTLHPILGPIGIDCFLVNIGVLLLPAATVGFIRQGRFVMKFPSLISTEVAFRFALAAALMGAAYMVIVASGSAGFDIDSSYIRRLAARDIFTDRSVGAYVSSITMNGLLPVLAFYAGLRDRWLWLQITLFCAGVFYYTLGVKAHVLMCGLGWLLGRGTRQGRLSSMPGLIGLLVTLLFLAFFIEYILFEYSYVGDYLLRRLFSVPPSLLSAYFDLIVNPLQAWGPWSGIDSPYGVTFLVGDLYFNDPDANANTNGFVHQLAANGVLMYIASMFLVGLVFKVIDSCYATKKSAVFIGIGFIYGVLLVEQGATTALLSSGVGLLLLLFSVSGGLGGREGALALGKTPAKST